MQQENAPRGRDTHARGPFNVEGNTIRSLSEPAADSEHTIAKANLVISKDRASRSSIGVGGLGARLGN